VNELLFARKLKEKLDAGLKLPPDALARLKIAREQALAHYQAPASELVLAGRGLGALRLGGTPYQWPRILLPLIVLVVAVLGLHQWQEATHAARQFDQQAAEIEEVDAAVLTGELPINAYLDEDFLAWLKQSSQ
jgi:Protein of unknown function (DUF3619)